MSCTHASSRARFSRARLTVLACVRQDIDAIFALLRDHLINLDVYTPAELEAAIRHALADYPLPIIVKHVDATYDYIEYYKEHVDKALGG